jgi:hypothetical protein
MHLRYHLTSYYPLILVIMFIFSQSLLACSQNPTSQAPSAVENYYKALIDKDYNRMVSNSCAAWESQAKTDFDSFAAVTATLMDIHCETTSQENNDQIVACSGKIVANYGNESLEIDLSKQNYLVVQESGEWRMCGYR